MNKERKKEIKKEKRKKKRKKEQKFEGKKRNEEKSTNIRFITNDCIKIPIEMGDVLTSLTILSNHFSILNCLVMKALFILC